MRRLVFIIPHAKRLPGWIILGCSLLNHGGSNRKKLLDASCSGSESIVTNQKLTAGYDLHKLISYGFIHYSSAHEASTNSTIRMHIIRYSYTWQPWQTIFLI
jgi:hypothetical protein